LFVVTLLAFSEVEAPTEEEPEDDNEEGGEARSKTKPGSGRKPENKENKGEKIV
jgi:hypothetical protein